MQGFGFPHDLAVSSDGRMVLVGEIEPNRIWKLEHRANYRVDDLVDDGDDSDSQQVDD